VTRSRLLIPFPVNTLSSVFTGNGISNLDLVTSDDDRGGFYTSTLQFNARRGTSYQIWVDGFGYAGTGGEFTLSWVLEPSSATTPVLVVPPQPQGVLKGGTATFQVLADSPKESYQWFFNREPIAGATGSVYTVTGAKTEDVGFYSVRVSNGTRAVLSSEADLQLAFFDGAAIDDNYHALTNSKTSQAPRPTGIVPVLDGSRLDLVTPLASRRIPLRMRNREIPLRAMRLSSKRCFRVCSPRTRAPSKLIQLAAQFWRGWRFFSGRSRV
jgi:hypothetical protein